MEFSINIARSKGQKVKVKPVFPRNVSSCMSLFGIVLHAVHVMFTCYTSEPVQTGSNRFKLVQTGSNWFKPVQTGKNPEKKVQTGSNREKPRKQVHRQQWRLTCAFPFPRGRHLPLCDMRGDIDHNVTYMETLTAM